MTKAVKQHNEYLVSPGYNEAKPKSKLSHVWSFIKMNLLNFILFPLILAMGVGLAIYMFYTFQRIDNTQIEKDVDSFSRIMVSRFEDDIRSCVGTMKGFVGYYYGSDLVNFLEFKEFFNTSMAADFPEVISFQWIPIVPFENVSHFLDMCNEQNVFKLDAPIELREWNDGTYRNISKRDFYYPVLYNYPTGKSDEKMGLDLGTVPHLNETLLTSIQMKSQIASKIIQKGENFIISVFAPIGLEYLDKTLDKHVGLIRGEFLFDPWIHEVEDLIVYVFDGNQSVFRKGPEGSQSVSISISQIEGNYKVVSEVKVIDRVWTIVIVASPQFESSRENYYKWVGLVSCIVGGLFAAIIAILFVKIVQLFITIRKKSKQQTKELVAAKEISSAIAKLDMDSKALEALKSKHLKECSPLEIALRKIIDNFTIYKQYLPATLLAQNDEIEDEEMQKQESQSTIEKYGSVGSIEGRTLSKHLSSVSSDLKKHFSSVSSDLKTKSSMKTQTVRNINTDVGLRKKNAVIMQISLKNFKEIVTNDIYSPENIHDFHTQYVTNMINAAKENCKADFHYFRGDKMLFSWNAVSLRFNSAIHACQAALECVKVFNEKVKPVAEKYGFPSLDIHIGIVGGYLLCGNIGSQNIKQFDLMGAPMLRLNHITIHNSTVGTNILVEESIMEIAKYQVTAYPVDKVQLQVTSSLNEKVVLYEPKKMKSIEADEWIYELQQAEKDDLDKDFLQAWNDILNGNIDKAKTLIELNLIKNHTHEETIAWERLKKLANSTKQGERYIRILNKTS